MMDELISRREALEAINRIWDRCEEIEAHLPEGDPDRTGYKMIADYLTVWKYLSAQPERKTGQWISMTSYSNSYKCSVCGRMLINITDGKNTVTKNYPYCHCGAKMLKTEN